MHTPSSWLRRAVLAALPLAAALATTTAHALPSFARQTGQDCVACHVGAFGPQLTPFGIKFKLGGYVDSDGKAGKVPLSGMLVANSSKFKNDVGDSTTKTNLAEASAFLAGKMTNNIGTFVQVTYDGVNKSTALDQADVRFVGNTNVSGKDLLVGLSVNNNPTVSDPFNTLAVWRFPYTESPYANATASTSLGGADQRVLGLNAYALFDNNVYGELGLFNTLSPTVQNRLGHGPLADAEGFGRVNNAPYYRLGYFKDLRTSAWSVGLFGMAPKIKDRATGVTKLEYNDFGIDGSYQFLGNREHIVTVNGSYTNEHVKTPANDGTGDVATYTAKDLKLAASYHYQNTYGANLGLFKGTTTDQSSAYRGYTFQLDWTPTGKESSWGAPWANVRVGLQYTAYTEFMEGSVALDKPSDKNSLMLFAWTSF